MRFPKLTKNNERTSLIALVALLIGAAAIGLAPIFTRESPVGPVATAFWRLFLPIPIFWAIAFWQRDQKGAPFATPWHALVLTLPGIFFGIDMALWNTSIMTTSVSNATLLTNISPVFVALISWFIFKERFTPLFLIGMVASLVGTVMLMGSSLQIKPEHFPGDVIGAISGLFYGSYVLSLSRLRQRFPAARLMMHASLAASPLLFVAAWGMGQPIFFDDPTAARWAPLLALALISHVCGQGLIAYALAHLPVTFSALGLLFQPVVATIAAYLIYGEALAPLQLLGGLVVMAGVFVCRLGLAAKKEHLEEQYD